MSSFVPDYNKQTVSDRPIGSVFVDPNKRPDYDQQGDPSSASQASSNNDFGERRGRVQREASGATSARSGSVSRDRASLAAEDRGRAGPEYNAANLSSAASAAGRNASQSPSRAMGARSVSIERGGGAGSQNRSTSRTRSRMDTLEGIGASVEPIMNPDALGDSGRGRRPGGSGDTFGSGNRVVSPSRAMGARSVIREE